MTSEIYYLAAMSLRVCLFDESSYSFPLLLYTPFLINIYVTPAVMPAPSLLLLLSSAAPIAALSVTAYTINEIVSDPPLY